MKIENTSSRWVAGLSNGETVVEGKGIAERIEGQDSPWWKLQTYLEQNNLQITSLGIWINDRHYNLPSNKPKFGGEIPLRYNFFRKVSVDYLTGSDDYEHYICVEAIYDTYKIQMYVDENDTNKMWISVANGND